MLESPVPIQTLKQYWAWILLVCDMSSINERSTRVMATLNKQVRYRNQFSQYQYLWLYISDDRVISLCSEGPRFESRLGRVFSLKFSLMRK